MRLTIATLNLWGLAGPQSYRARGVIRGAVPGSPAVEAPLRPHGWTRRRDLAAAALRKAVVDVVGLQEVAVDPVDGSAQSAQLARDLGLDHVTAGSLGLLSRYPVRESRQVQLLAASEDTGYGSPYALHALLATHTGELDVLVAHFTPRSATLRVEAAAALAAYVDDLPPRPRAIVGDLNTTASTTPELDVLAMAGLVDAWRRARPADPGLTMPSHEPAVRLDYVLLGAGLQPPGPDDVGHVAADPDADGFYASDHRGVVVRTTTADRATTRR